MKSAIQWPRQATAPLSMADRTLTLETQALTMRLPFGGLVWNRPTAVVVSENGQTQRLSIPDVTRQAVLALWGIALAGMLLMRWRRSGRRLSR